MANNKSNKFQSKEMKAFPELFGSRVPPHSNDAEIAVLGSMMLDRYAISKVIDTIDENSFYSEQNRKIFQTMLAMFDRGISVDIVTLMEELSKKGLLESIGGSVYLMEINSKVPTAANVEHYARIVQERYIKRALITTAGKIMNNCYDETTDALEEVDSAERDIFEIGEKRFIRSYSELKKIAHDTYDLISKLSEQDRPGITGVPTGYGKLDDLLGGFQKSDLIIIAGRPSMGKTALALSLARNAAVNFKKPLAFFSIEMSAVQLVIRLISAESKINQQKIRTGRLTQDDLSRIVRTLGKLSNSPILIDDSPTLNLMEIRAKCRRLKAEHNIEMVMIDYLQLIHPPKADSREREISIISRSLKQLAKELNIPVIAMAQLNRTVESRADKRPMLSDLRESGSIEQDADVVCFINRPEVYGIKEYEDKTPTEGTAEVIVGKQRNGPIGTIQLAYLKDYARFENLELRYEEPPPYLAGGAGDMPPVAVEDDDEAPF